MPRFHGRVCSQEVNVSLHRKFLLILLTGALVAGCAGIQRVERPEGPFEIAILAVADTRGELEPCG
jgi:hypothetical protein